MDRITFFHALMKNLVNLSIVWYNILKKLNSESCMLIDYSFRKDGFLS